MPRSAQRGGQGALVGIYTRRKRAIDSWTQEFLQTRSIVEGSGNRLTGWAPCLPQTLTIESSFLCDQLPVSSA